MEVLSTFALLFAVLIPLGMLGGVALLVVSHVLHVPLRFPTQIGFTFMTPGGAIIALCILVLMGQPGVPFEFREFVRYLLAAWALLALTSFSAFILSKPIRSKYGVEW